MSTSYSQKYCDYVANQMQKIMSTQNVKIRSTGMLMADCIMDGRRIFAYGPSHAGMFAEEMFYRAGGLVPVNPLFHSGMMLNTRPVTLTSDMESLPGYASIILAESAAQKGDLLLIHSVAGRNSVVIEMAIKAREKGICVIGIINMDYATQVTSRDPSGKMLYEVCDEVIDTCGKYGDAVIQMEGLEQMVAPSSTPAAAFIANALILEACDILLQREVQPPVFKSANVDGGAAFNAKLLEEYKDVIHYMG